jgi:hypothetical protein
MVFTKDIMYPPTEVVKNDKSATQLLSFALADPGTYLRMSNVLLQVTEGSQMWVSKEVSDDLQMSSIDPGEIKFEDVAWPHHRMEVYFEDPSLPTFLAVKATNRKQMESVQRLIKHPMASENEDPAVMATEFIHVQAMTADTSMVSLTYKPSEVDKFAAGDELPDSSRHHYGMSGAMEQEEQEELRRLTVLLFKLLLFAGAEGFEPRVTREKPTRKQGGKAGFKNRPTTDRIIIAYLPHHHAQRKEQEAAAVAEAGGTKKFLGRRGHFRHFRADCFKEMKGKRRFIFPIPGPDGTVPRMKFVVRK